MALTINDSLVDLSGNAISGGVVTTRPDTLLFQLINGAWVAVQGSGALTTATSATGGFSVVLPDPSVTDPSPVTWTITLPAPLGHSARWQGQVPAGVTGPLTLQQLYLSYGWKAV